MKGPLDQQTPSTAGKPGSSEAIHDAEPSDDAAATYVRDFKRMITNQLRVAEEFAKQSRERIEALQSELDKCKEELDNRDATIKDMQNILDVEGSIYEGAVPEDVERKVDDINKRVELLVSSLVNGVSTAANFKASNERQKALMREQLHKLLYEHVCLPFVSLTYDQFPLSKLIEHVRHHDGNSVAIRTQARLRRAVETHLTSNEQKDQNLRSMISSFVGRFKASDEKLVQNLSKLREDSTLRRHLHDLVSRLCDATSDVRERLLQREYHIVLEGYGAHCVLRLKPVVREPQDQIPSQEQNLDVSLLPDEPEAGDEEIADASLRDSGAPRQAAGAQ
ncbi:hypothetical protein CBOM_04059 [Ceraceosorus bombacis]|uniref:Uncharacterized protein n=1 Tax=Ceraceosorus bombacis TaxID=401625 RepID=A0A0P1BLY1_9BASI|nr:hypothetical protein CBOM_04059 [Ceraceosorus bombacis]